MMILLTLVSSIQVYASYAPYLVSEKQVETKVEKVGSVYGRVYSYQEILSIVTPAAHEYGVSVERMMYTIEAESHFKNVQSSCHRSDVSSCDSVGVREESYGVAQFHVSTLSKEKSLDIYTAIDNMAYYFSIGESCRWTEYRKKYGC